MDWRGAPSRSRGERLFPVDADRGERRLLAAAQDFEQHRATPRLLGVGDALGERLGGRHRTAVDAEDHVAPAQALGARVAAAGDRRDYRSEERRGGKEWASTCRARWAPFL